MKDTSTCAKLVGLLFAISISGCPGKSVSIRPVDLLFTPDGSERHRPVSYWINRYDASAPRERAQIVRALTSILKRRVQGYSRVVAAEELISIMDAPEGWSEYKATRGSVDAAERISKYKAVIGSECERVLASRVLEISTWGLPSWASEHDLPDFAKYILIVHGTLRVGGNRIEICNTLPSYWWPKRIWVYVNDDLVFEKAYKEETFRRRWDSGYTRGECKEQVGVNVLEYVCDREAGIFGDYVFRAKVLVQTPHQEIELETSSKFRIIPHRKMHE